MPGVLVDSASSSPHHHRSFFPFEPVYLPSGNLGNGGSYGPVPSGNPRNGAFENSELPTSSHSPLPPSHLQSSSELFCSSPPSPTDAARELYQHARPRSNLGILLNSNDTEQSYGSSFEMLPELNSLPIPSPRKNFHSTRPDSIAGSPVLSDINAVGSPVLSDVFSAFHKFLPSNNDEELWPADAFTTTDVYSCDDFRMYEFKVRRCMKGRSHDWTECPFAHPGEKARRRDPRRFHYSGTSCPDFRKGSCKRGDACEFAHGVFECWLHPARYRTQPCKDGRACRRRVCFFAHTLEQLRVLPSAMVSASPASPSAGISSPSSKMSMAPYDGSPLRQALGGSFIAEASDGDNLQKIVDNKRFGSTLVFGNVTASSPNSTLYGQRTSSPPPLSPSLSPPSSPPTYTEAFSYLPRNVTVQMHPPSPLSNSPIPEHRRHLNRLQSVPTITIPPAASEVLEAGMFDELIFRSPTSASSPRNEVSELRHALQALQLRSRVADIQRTSSTPVSPLSHKWSSTAQISPLRHCLYRSIHGTATTESLWDLNTEANIESQSPERVESGRSLRAEIYGKIGKDNGVDTNSSGEVPDLGWVNELVK